jgi:WD40 repeat protein
LKQTLAGHRDSVLGVCFTSDGKTLASASKDKTVRLWDAGAGQPAGTLEGHAGEVMSVAVSPDDRLLASCGGKDGQGELLLWDAKEQRQVASLPGPNWKLYDVAFNHDGSLLASVGHGDQVKLYDVASRTEYANMESGQPILARRVLFTADGRKLITCGDFLNVYDVAAKSRLFAVPHSGTSDVRLSPRGDVLAAADWKGGKITLYNFETMEPLSSWQAQRPFLDALAFSPDGRYLACTGDGRLLKIWELPSRRLRAIAFSPGGAFYAVAFSPDGQTLATSESQPDYKIYLWDVSALD